MSLSSPRAPLQTTKLHADPLYDGRHHGPVNVISVWCKIIISLKRHGVF